MAAAPFVPGFEFSDAMTARLELFNQAAEQGREPFLDRVFGDSHFIPAPLGGPEVLRRNKFLAVQIPAAEERIIVQAGHNGPLENPAAFLDEVIPFLASIARD